MLVAMLFLTFGALVIALQDGEPGSQRASAQVTVPSSIPATSAPPADTTTAPPPSTAPPTTVPPDVSVPVGQVGAFTTASGETTVTGTGNLVTYTVEVEDAVGYAIEEFSRIVDETLADPRSWTADGAVSFQRVPSGGQVRIVLGTPGTVDQLCLPLQTNGIFSCHQNGTVALNSGRWLDGTDSWPGPLDDFRRYAVNHEVGHAIGHGHVSCTGVGEPAPVMMQQSKGLEGCLPNGWPFP